MVLTLRQKYLPGTAVWAYGSRVKGTARPHSDLDLVVFASPQLRRAIPDLREAFEESDLPFRVDLFGWDELPESFHRAIAADHRVLQQAAEN
ncbi:nucleotidyltransferase family protein [Leptolyngbya sp. KIOST-1]|uniref:nucleotidyltransferase family protein n=1 Tax=Leptolyngbya sp. KIOST-1 TaxID=1229172 RepID=UPI00068AD920|nr:nucleotidyltransferase domain-containing protein [Leptolyngbya sp. KIOST-1]